MDRSYGGEVAINSFALVSYFSGPLAEYLTRLRRELVPDCEARAHLTILPPRPIQGTADDAVWFFDGTKNGMAIFKSTQVPGVSHSDAPAGAAALKSMGRQ